MTINVQKKGEAKMSFGSLFQSDSKSFLIFQDCNYKDIN